MTTARSSNPIFDYRTTKYRHRIIFLIVIALLLVMAPTVSASERTASPPDTVVDEISTFEVGETGEGWEMSPVVDAPIAFTMIGFRGPIDVELQARVAGDTWSDWFSLAYLDEDDGPDVGSHEDRATEKLPDGYGYTAPAWVGEADRVQVRVVGGSVADVTASIIDGDGVSRSLFQRAADLFRPSLAPEPAEASTPLNVISRREWGADESKRNGSPRYADNVTYGVVHHTAHTTVNPNGYTRTQAPAIMRSMYAYHTDTLGWADIGYNLVVDRFGNIYEGRFGGLGRGVIGAHAGGFNTGSFGVAVMGSFQTEVPSKAAWDAVVDVLAWKSHVHDITPNSSVTVTSGGSSQYPRGTKVTLNTIAAHRETGYTACPGAAFYAQFGELRSAVAAKTAPQPPDHGFPDVSSDRYFHRPVSWLKAADITDGYGKTGKYEPDAAVTRGQMAAFVWRLAGKPTGYPDHGFPDVPSNRYYNDAVRWMKAKEITDGFGDTGLFKPDRTVTRGETAAFLWRYVGKPAGDPGHGFPDVSGSAHYNQAVRWMRANGLTDGFGSTGEYRPDQSVTRGEMSAMLYRLASTPPAWRSSSSISPHATFR